MQRRNKLARNGGADVRPGLSQLEGGGRRFVKMMSGGGGGGTKAVQVSSDDIVSCILIF